MRRDYPTHYREGAIAHRDVDALEFTGTVTCGGQPRHHREGRIDPGDVVHDRRADAKRRGRGCAGHRHQTRHCLDYVVIGRPGGKRTILTEPGNRDEDQPGVNTRNDASSKPARATTPGRSPST